jgi:hypothetical protein
MAYREDEGQELSLAELQADLEQLANPGARQSLRDGAEDERFYWHLLFNLKRSCERLDVPVPYWLEDLCRDAPPEEAEPAVVFAGTE